MAIRLGFLAPLLVLFCSLCVLSNAHPSTRSSGMVRSLLQEDAKSMVQEVVSAENSDALTEDAGGGEGGGDPDTVPDPEAEPMEGKATAQDTGEETVSEVKVEAEIKAATEEKLVEEEEENNLPHGTPSWHPARAHNHGEGAEDIDVDEAGVIVESEAAAAPAQMSPATIEDQGLQTPEEAAQEEEVKEAVEQANEEAELVAEVDAESAASEEIIDQPAVLNEATTESVAETEAEAQEEAAAEEASEVAAVEEAEFVAEAQAQEEAVAAADEIIEQEATAGETLPKKELAVDAVDVLDDNMGATNLVQRKRTSRRLLSAA